MCLPACLRACLPFPFLPAFPSCLPACLPFPARLFLPVCLPADLPLLPAFLMCGCERSQIACRWSACRLMLEGKMAAQCCHAAVGCVQLAQHVAPRSLSAWDRCVCVCGREGRLYACLSLSLYVCGL